MSAKIGRLRDILTFGRLIPAQDGQGGRTTNFEEIGRVYAQIEKKSEVRELDGASRNVVLFNFVSRYIDGVDSACVVKLNNNADIWQIEGVIDMYGRHELLTGVAWREV